MRNLRRYTVFLLIIGSFLVGCGGLLPDIDILPTQKTKAAEAKQMATPEEATPTPRPTFTLVATPASRGVVPSPTPRFTAVPTVDTADLVLACDRLWDVRMEGQDLADEWNAWIAEDPPSIDEHLKKVEEMATAWDEHYKLTSSVSVPSEAAQAKSVYLSAVDAWRTSMRFEASFLTREKPEDGLKSEQEMERARERWDEAYYALDRFCKRAEASASGVDASAE